MSYNLLDTLRYLNEENINDNPELRDRFFDSLIDLGSYRLDNGKAEESVKRWMNHYDELIFGENNRLLACDVVNYLCRELLYFNKDYLTITDTSIKFNVDELWFEVLGQYKCIIIGLKRLVKSHPCVFFEIKKTLLEIFFLKTYYTILKDKVNELNELNRLIMLYAEHLKVLEPFGEIPVILDNDNFGEFSINIVVNANNMRIIGSSDADMYNKAPINVLQNYINERFPVLNRCNSKCLYKKR